MSVPPLLPPHLVSPLGAAVGWHWELSQHSSAPFGTPATDPLLTTRRFLVGSTMCLGTTKGVSSKPLDQRFQGYREPKTRQVPGKSCPASQAMCHPTRCWGPHLGYTWNLSVSQAPNIPGFPAPRRAGWELLAQGRASKLLKCIRRGKRCRGKTCLDD